MSVNTTHLVALDDRRTINILRGLIRGTWILTYDWILKSIEANQWQPEAEFERKSFSRTVEVSAFQLIVEFSMKFFLAFQQINRIERQAFGRHYRMDIFRNYDGFFLAPKLSCKYLRELITLCYGKVTQNLLQSRYFITERYRNDIDNGKLMQLHPNWVLDSITCGKVQTLRKYIVNSNTQSNS